MSAPAGWAGAGADPWADAAGRPMRALRASVFAGAGLGLAVAAHLLGGGTRPAPAVLALAAACLFGLGLAVSGRERSGRQVAALVVTTQAALHAAFALVPAGSAAMHPASRANWAALLFCQHGERPVSAAQIAAARAGLGLGPDTATPAHSLIGWGAAAMLAAHLLAAGVLAWWLRRGERAAWATLRRIVTRLGRVLALVTPAAPARPVPVTRGWVPVRRVGRSAAAGRAPPRGLRTVLLTG